MKCEIAILSGARAGTRETIDKAYIGLGRHPMSDVRFDAEKDIDASTRHAAILLSGAQYTLRDLGSTNGTYVNGHRVSGDVQLKDGDVIRCGVHGPEVSFKVVLTDEEQALVRASRAVAGERGAASGKREERQPSPGAAHPGSRTPKAAAPAAPSKTSVLRAEIAAQKSRFRAITAFLLIVLVGSASVLVWTNKQSLVRQQAAEAKADSLSRVTGQMEAAKKQTDSIIGALHRQLAAETNPARRAALQADLTTAVTRKQTIEHNIAVADQVDFAAVSGNAKGVAVVIVQFQGDSVPYAGTGFNIDPSGRLLTNKHVVAGEHFDKTIERMAVQFSGSAEVLRARLDRVSPTSDIALVQVTDAGPFPTVAGLAQDASPRAGDPVFLLGFPGYSGDRDIPHATLVTGNVDEIVTDSLLRLEAYSGTGGSGSPILDRNGHVIGIEFGGIVGHGGRAVLGLPIRRALSLLNH